MKNIIDSSEYPPKYVGYKGDGSWKMVYRIDGEMGLVFHIKNHNETEYRWEHFVKIK